jgi:hypothetical protein
MFEIAIQLGVAISVEAERGSELQVSGIPTTIDPDAGMIFVGVKVNVKTE